jgi:hypothetical protein
MRYCGRHFDPREIELIRALLTDQPQSSRYRLSLQVCERLNWRKPNGTPKDMSCRVALLRMQADGLITLPPPRWSRPVTYLEHPHIERAVLPPAHPPQVELSRLSIDPIATKHDSLLWNAYIQRHHYLGHQPMPGAQLRYFVRAHGEILALFGFGASAWKIKPRDAFIGWSCDERRRNLHLIVNNARFLILPWINCRNLASRALALTGKRLADDWQARYAYRPVLLETFIEDQRFRGTCYQAANWRCLGKTKGRGKLDSLHSNSEPVKSIWVYPLVRNFRSQLRN